MVEACSGGVGQGTCALAGDTPESTRPNAVALVVWQGGALLEATVRVGQGNGQWVSRQLVFSNADPERDRWVTVGLTVASLLDEARTASPADSPAATPTPSLTSQLSVPPAPPPEARVDAQRPSLKAEERIRRFGLGAGLLWGKGWDAGAPMTGGWATVTLNLFQGRFFALVGGSFALSSGPTLSGGAQLKSRWLGFDAGIGIQTRVAPFRFFAAPVVALQSVSADLGATGTRGDRELELKLRGGTVWEVSNRWGFSAQGALRVLPVESPSDEPARARRSGVAGELMAGVELRL